MNWFVLTTCRKLTQRYPLSLNIVRHLSHDQTVCLLWQIKHMMAFIEQEAREKVEEIDAKVIDVCLPVSQSCGCAAVSNDWALLSYPCVDRRRKSSTLRKAAWCRLSGWKSWSITRRRRSRLNNIRKCELLVYCRQSCIVWEIWLVFGWIYRQVRGLTYNKFDQFSLDNFAFSLTLNHPVT